MLSFYVIADLFAGVKGGYVRKEGRQTGWAGFTERSSKEWTLPPMEMLLPGLQGLAPHGLILSWSCDPELLLRSFPRAWNATPCSQYSFQFSVDFPSRGVAIHTLLVIPAPGNELLIFCIFI